MRTIIFLLLSNVLLGQVHNPQFEEWDLYNGREKPAEWFCPNLCQGSGCGPCDKIVQSVNDFAVRIHNVMPCVSNDNQAKNRSPGFIHEYFIPTSNHFKISFDLIIDSIETPALFKMTIQGKGLPPSGIIWETDSLQSQRIVNDILLDTDYDSVFIRFESKGYLKSNPLHDCDLGYISAIVDSIETEDIAITKEFNRVNIHVVPNPFIQTLTIESDFTSLSWNLLDITGHLVLTGHSNKIHGLDKLTKGIYLLQVMEGPMIYVEKVVKQ